MLGVLAKFGTNLRRERQLEGIQRRPPSGRGGAGAPTDIAKALKIGPGVGLPGTGDGALSFSAMRCHSGKISRLIGERRLGGQSVDRVHSNRAGPAGQPPRSLTAGMLAPRY
jgi:hypothetical protein